MKKYLWIIILFALFLGSVIALAESNRNLNKKYEIAEANVKAYNAQLTEQKQMFQFTVDQLQYINDSTVKELDSIRKELKIKDSKIKQMGKIKEYVYINDTIRLTDTLFKEPSLNIDTCLGDQWYTNCLHLKYPNIIGSSISVNTDLNCFIHSKREPVNTPKKTWIGRLFQKKHTVIDVTVKENNPYSNVKEVKFIKILDK